MKKWSVVLVLSLLWTPKVFGQELTRILFILDASNSMNANWGEQTRIQATLLHHLEDQLGVAADVLRVGRDVRDREQHREFI